MAAAIVNATSSSASTIRTCHSARAAATMPRTTSVAIAARRAVSAATRDFSPGGEYVKPMLRAADEQVFLDARRHGIVLLRPLLKAGLAAVAGAAAIAAGRGWSVSAAGATLLALAAAVAVGAVWRWDRTQVVVTSEKLFVVHGVVRRR